MEKINKDEMFLCKNENFEGFLTILFFFNEVPLFFYKKTKNTTNIL